MTDSVPVRGLRLKVFTLFFAAFAVGTDNFGIAGVLRSIAAGLHVSYAAAGQLVTGFAIVYAIGAPLLAALVSRWPRRATMITATLLFTAVNALAAVAPSYAVLLPMRLLAALFAAVITPAALSTAAVLAPRGQQGRYLGLVAAGLTISLVAGVPIGTWLSSVLSWRATMVLVACLATLAAAGMTALPGQYRLPPVSLKKRLAPLGTRAILAGLIGTCVSAAGGLMFYAYIAPIVRYASGTGSQGLAVLIAIAGICGAAGTVLGGRAADRIGPERTLIFALGTQAAATLVMAALTQAAGHGRVPVVAAGVLFAAWALGGWALNPPVQLRLIRLAREAGTEVVALNSSAMYAGIAVAGAAGGALLAFSGVTAVELTAGLLGLCALALYTVAFRKQWAAPAEPLRAKVDAEADHA